MFLKETDSHTDRGEKSKRKKQRETDKRREKQTDRQTDNQPARQTDKKAKTDRDKTPLTRTPTQNSTRGGHGTAAIYGKP